MKTTFHNNPMKTLLMSTMFLLSTIGEGPLVEPLSYADVICICCIRVVFKNGSSKIQIFHHLSLPSTSRTMLQPT